MTYYVKQYWDMDDRVIYYKVNDKGWKTIKWSKNTFILNPTTNTWDTIARWCSKEHSEGFRYASLYKWKVLTEHEAFVEML